MIWIRGDVQSLFAGAERVEDFGRIPSEVARRFRNRHTGRIERGGRGFYIKYHGPLGWHGTLLDLVHFRLPSRGARDEWEAARRLEALGVRTLRVAAYGEEGRFAPARRSFVLTDEIAPAVSLEDLAKDWAARPPPPAFRQRLARALGDCARSLHRGGLNHRDFYLCHFLLATPRGLEAALHSEPELHLIDLHRVQARRRTPRRWVVKDLAGLCFSSLDAGLTRSDVLRFVRAYSGGPLRRTLREDRQFWARVESRAMALYRKFWGREPKLPAWRRDAARIF
jgi:heptose I phosphotransferase